METDGNSADGLGNGEARDCRGWLSDALAPLCLGSDAIPDTPEMAVKVLVERLRRAEVERSDAEAETRLLRAEKQRLGNVAKRGQVAADIAKADARRAEAKAGERRGKERKEWDAERDRLTAEVTALKAQCAQLRHDARRRETEMSAMQERLRKAIDEPSTTASTVAATQPGAITISNGAPLTRSSAGKRARWQTDEERRRGADQARDEAAAAHSSALAKLREENAKLREFLRRTSPGMRQGVSELPVDMILPAL